MSKKIKYPLLMHFKKTLKRFFNRIYKALQFFALLFSTGFDILMFMIRRPVKVK